MHQHGAVLGEVRQLRHPPFVDVMLAQIAAHEGIAVAAALGQGLIPELKQSARDIGDVPVVIRLVEVDDAGGRPVPDDIARTVVAVDKSIVMSREAVHPVGQLIVDQLEIGRACPNGRLNVQPELLYTGKVIINGGIALVMAGGGVQLAERLPPGAVDREFEQIMFQILSRRFELGGSEKAPFERFDECALDRWDGRADRHTLFREEAQKTHDLARFGQGVQGLVADAEVEAASADLEAVDDVVILADKLC